MQSEIRSFEKFGFPLLSRVAVVQRNPDGLSPCAQAEAVTRARAVTEGESDDIKPIVAAVPVMNTLGLFPGSQESGTTIITLLFTPPEVTFGEQLAAARRFVDGALRRRRRRGRRDRLGAGPGRAGRIVLARRCRGWSWPPSRRCFLIIALAFRSLVAPLIALAVAGVAILLTLHIGGALALRLGVPVPQETQPLLVALLLGVVTDYVVFYLSAVRSQLAAGDGTAGRGRNARPRGSRRSSPPPG